MNRQNLTITNAVTYISDSIMHLLCNTQLPQRKMD